jgi:hypothetical protein
VPDANPESGRRPGELGLGELRRAVREQAGLDVVSLVPAGGESGAAFWVRERGGAAWLLKVTPASVTSLQALDALTGRLRARGYPAPRLRAIGQLGGLVPDSTGPGGRASDHRAFDHRAFWIQERMPGRGLSLAGGAPDCVAVSRLLPELFRLNDAQAGLGGGGADWRQLITTTLLAGGDGYCLHSTMAARPDTRELLSAVRGIGASCGPAIPSGVDFTHFDFHFLNLLSDGTTITGVIDINPPPLAGDRAFDLATLVFYVYDHDELRRRILDRLFGLAGRQAARAYLAHMVLRQVEWSVRHHPAAPASRRHLHLARLILADIGEPDRAATSSGRTRR